MTNQKLTHFDIDGNAHMVDVGEKSRTLRCAIAEGYIGMEPNTLNLIESGGHKKGDVLSIARLAGIMGAKQTSNLIPLCHPISLTHIEVKFEIDTAGNRVRCTVMIESVDRTGVEMEAMNAVQITLLTIYDMCKKVDRGMTIGPVRLLEKAGGSSGSWKRSYDK
ncbi:MAG: cyclic pyranopterin monophosphate synthase MoaC [Gammaproteobacteria bacterium]|nr:cyclic pyranopterin monophosphate synthase MoaC [Gammaproteobacteria bacterium]|tara:strand:- start:163 stop:654 length:492 start_codon:yes stop_codon:yes gene_type:complete